MNSLSFSVKNRLLIKAKTRGTLLSVSLGIVFVACTTQPAPIDRYDWVNRHNILIEKVDPLSPLTVGNGDFAFTADITGMQSFDTLYYHQGIALETLSSWAWHSFPNTENLRLEDAMQESDFHGRKIAYASLEKSPAGEYFRKNPHPIALGQISLVNNDGTPFDLSALGNIHQTLNLWEGLMTSSYTINGQPVTIETVSHPELSMVAFKIKSPLIASGAIKPSFRFPYSYDLSTKNKPAFDWNHPDRHQTKVTVQGPGKMILERCIDDSRYFVTIQWQAKGIWETKGPHDFQLDGSGSDSLLLVCCFSPDAPLSDPPTFEATKKAASDSWKKFWTEGGVIDLSGSKDPRAPELERRIVLSEYLVKVNYSGAFPPQETGLTNISWYGKHNSEMYWWHAAQFYQWNHTDLLEKGLQWYIKILPLAMADAQSKGLDGARWPKMSGQDGRPSPGGINPFIIWNQPNPIYLSELVYRAHPDTNTLKKYQDLVFESAKFLASYAYFDTATHRYILGPPVKSVNEKNAENLSKNPSFELAYWYYGLQIAQQWRERLGIPREALWDDILQKLSPLTQSDGLYVDLETEPDIYKRKGSVPSSMLMALGFLPQTPMVDPEIMKATFNEVTKRNGTDSYISWSMAKGAMTAARLGDTQTAVNILCNDAPSARFLPNGHVQRAKEPLGCPAYLPVNSSFLSAVALMAAGWDGAPDIPAPGFPQDGTWTVRTENLNRLP